MGLLTDAVLKLRACANKRTVTIVMMYLYILTVFVLIVSHVRLAKEHFSEDSRIKVYLTRHINSDAQSNIGHNEHTFKKSQLEILKPEVKIKRHVPPQEKDGNKKEIVETKTNNALSVNNKVIKNKESTKQTNRIKHAKYPNVEIIENIQLEHHPIAVDEAWQNVTEDGTFMVYSAFLDNVNGHPHVRGLGMNGNTFLPKFYCELTYTDDVIVTLKGRIWMLPDHHEKTYKAVFLYCPLPDDKVPRYLSILPISGPVRLHKIPVMHHPKETRNFTVCLSPLFFNYSIEYELVQWIELNKIIGAEKFFIYNYSTVGRTDDILNHYQREGTVKVIQWKLPNYTDPHYKGQLAMVNDCFFRNYRVSKYMVNIDIDEYIIPRKSLMSWNELMTSLPQDACEYNFRSCFMSSESKNVFEGKQKARELHIDILLRQSRREYIFDKNVRSKYMVNTRCVDTVGIHYCWKYRNGTASTQRFHVGPRDSLMYHVRNEPVAKKGKEVEERAIYKYHTKLIENVKNRWEKIAKNYKRAM